MLDFLIKCFDLGLYFLLVVLIFILVGTRVLFKVVSRICSNTESIRHRDSAGRFFCG